ncbi:hypothetical protein RF11_15661 [Thelohanellus kitauei]|uniref:Uncharacterized protein n=1 Tax=Thelohanellus kitauei TaxID=669202 RepID=A0A0C2IX09_THEKT|nr:hypothetical protein RF11_15661 [Thelohanellus kitauei]
MEESDLFAIYLNKKTNTTIKNEKDAKNLDLNCFEKMCRIEIVRNEYSYIVEALIDMLRLLIDILYSRVNDPKTIFDFDTNIAIACPREFVSNRLVFSNTKTFKFENYYSPWFSLMAFIDNDKATTRSILNILSEGGHIVLYDNDSAEIPSYTLFKHGEICYFYKISRIIIPESMYTIPCESVINKNSLNTKEFLALVKACRLAPKITDIASQTKLCAKNIKRNSLLFSYTKPEAKRSEKSEIIRDLLSIDHQRVLETGKTSGSESGDYLKILSQLSFLCCDLSPKHFQLFGIVRKTPFWSSRGPKTKIKLSNLFPRTPEPEDTVYEIYKKQGEPKVCLSELRDKHIQKMYDDSTLIPFAFEVDSTITLYQGQKLVSSKEVKNEAFDL